MCVNFIYECYGSYSLNLTPYAKWILDLKNFSWEFYFIISRVFARNSPTKYFFHISFCWRCLLTWSLYRGLTILQAIISLVWLAVFNSNHFISFEKLLLSKVDVYSFQRQFIFGESNFFHNLLSPNMVWTSISSTPVWIFLCKYFRDVDTVFPRKSNLALHLNIRLQEHSSDCLPCHIKGKVKYATELVKFSQSCVKTRYVWRE